jgi:PAS domain S-box-containing protein
VPVRTDDFAPHFEPLRRFRRQHAPAVRYGLAVATVGVAIIARMALESSLTTTRVPFITFFPALLVTTFLGGLGPGVVSLLLSAVAANYFFLPPLYSLQVAWGDGVALALFLAVGGIIVCLIHLLNEAIDRISIQEQNARLILETSPAGMIAVDDRGVITMVNGSAEKLFGYERSELVGQQLEVLVPERLRVAHAELRGTYMVLPSSRSMGAGRDLFARQKDGAELPVEIGLNPIVRETRTGALATVVDISERREAQRKQEILVREVQHRAKNLLAVVQAIAARTLTPDEGRQSFEAKLQALARTQELFFATGKATLESIVRAELAGFTDQVSIKGVDISLTPPAAQNFTLIVHELATNALKHGALSLPAGEIDVQWRTEGSQLAFDWVERGGPSVTPPTRKGFGQMILNDLAHSFGGDVVSEYPRAGFHYGLRIPLKSIEEAPSPVPPATYRLKSGTESVA